MPIGFDQGSISTSAPNTTSTKQTRAWKMATLCLLVTKLKVTQAMMRSKVEATLEDMIHIYTKI